MIPRWALFALPVAAVAVVALGLLTAAAPRPFRVARVLGGPTDGRVLSLRIEVADVIEAGSDSAERPVEGETVTLSVSAGNFEAVRSVRLDLEGAAEVRLDVPPEPRPLILGVRQADALLARGPVGLATERWVAAARRRGGWVSARASPDYEVRIAPERGALAVPFEEGLWIEVLRRGVPASDVRLGVRASGGRVAPASASTDARGRARFSLVPEEHTLGIRVALESGADQAEVAFGLPVVPGAMRARFVDGELLVEAPVPREVAYFALVTETARLHGGRVELRTDDRGESSARVEVPALTVAPRYAVVAGQRDLRSAAAVGWPLVPSVPPEPQRTFDAVDALLLDGRPRGALHEQARRARVRWSIVAFCALAALLELALLLALARQRDRALDAHLTREGVTGDLARRVAPVRPVALFVAAGAIALGFLLLAVAAVLRLR